MSAADATGQGGTPGSDGALVCAVHVVPAGDCDDRLDAYACRVFEQLASRRSAYKRIKKGEILLDGEPAQPQWHPRAGQRIELLASRTCPGRVFRLPLTVVHQDDWLAVIEKPPGIPVSGNLFRTVANALSGSLQPSVLPDALPAPLPVHRLDSPTGGLLLCGKTAGAMVALGHQFQARTVRKWYRAVLCGKLRAEPGAQGEVREAVEGRDACTFYRVVSHTRAVRTEWLTTVDAWPRTGRTHQIRRHFAHLGHPVVGDRAYGVAGQVLRGKGLFLWAVELEFEHPHSGSSCLCSVAEPAKFGSLRSREQRRWERLAGQDRMALS